MKNAWFMKLLLVGLSITSYFEVLTARGDDAVDYVRDVKPILKARCYACHGTLKQEAGLRVDSVELMSKGGDGGAAVVAGEGKQGALLERVTDTDEASRMPQEGARLTDTEIATLTRWIDAGAKAPADDAPEADPLEHWAFRRIVRPGVRGQGSGVRGQESGVSRNEIDSL